MGPLVPDIISNEFNFVVALIIGITFGFVLEQAGFSTTKKLVGLFYGYDFTVLKVFFTAGITAMIGVLLLNHLGLLDMNFVYINPTFINSALIGGAVMGAGFIIGGFCPGTSICAVATGKIDAFWFIIGGMLGIFIFMEFYPQFENMYLANNLGHLRMDTYLGMSKELVAFLLTAIALAAFVVTTRIQNKAHGIKTSYRKRKVLQYSISAALPFLVIAFIALAPSRYEHILKQAEKTEKQNKAQLIDADKLAIELANNNYEINLIDLRSPAKYNEYHLPLAINIPFDSLLNSEWKNYFKQRYKRNIFYADSIAVAKKAFVISQYIGDAKAFVLQQTTTQFKNIILDTLAIPVTALKKEMQLLQFRKETARTILQLDEKLKSHGLQQKKEVRKVKGGCS